MSTSRSFTRRIQDIRRRLAKLDKRIVGSRDDLLYHPQEAYTKLQGLQKQIDDLYNEYEEWAREFGAATGQPNILVDVHCDGLEKKVFLLGGQGHASLVMGKLGQALEIFQQALAVLGDQPNDSRDTILFYLGSISYQQGLFSQAEHYYSEAYIEGMAKARAYQQMLRNMTDPASQQQRLSVESTLKGIWRGNVETLSSLALCAFMQENRIDYARYMDQGKELAKAHALPELRRKLELSEWQMRVYSDATGESLSELNMLVKQAMQNTLSEDMAARIDIELFAADYCITLGRPTPLRMAARLLDDVEQLAKANSLLANLWSVRMARIELAKARNMTDQAREQARAALSEARHTRIQQQLQQALSALIQIQLRSGIPADRADADRHIKELQASGAGDALVGVLLDRALVLLNEDNAGAALRDVEKAESCGPQGNVRLQIQFAKVAVLRKLGRKQEALQLGLEAIEYHNEQLLPVDGPMLTQWSDVLNRLDSLYGAMASLLIEVKGSDHTREAFDLAEQGKAQLLRHQLVWSGRQANETSQGIPGITYADLHAMLVSESAALVMFGIQESNSWAFILDPTQPEPQYRKIDLTTALLKTLLPEVQESLDERNMLFGNLQPLSEQLLPPLRDVADHCKVLYIVPSSQLYAVPFVALTLDDFRLIDHCALAFVPSASVLNWCRSRYGELASHTCLALGVGAAPVRRSGGFLENISFAPQASAIAQLNWANRELLPETSTADDVLNRAPAYSVLHLACHGKVDPASSDILLASSLTLSNGAKLTAKQIYALNGCLGAELVFLNACVSANFHQGARNEVGGFWQAFLQAGASSLIATLTLVDPRTAQSLALAFYERWLAGDITKAEALRQAQLQMLNLQIEVPMLDRAIELYDWASHILIGYHR